MPDRVIPEWAVKVGAEVRDRTDQLPLNEPYLVDVTDLLQVIAEREARRHRQGDETAPTNRARIGRQCHEQQKKRRAKSE